MLMNKKLDFEEERENLDVNEDNNDDYKILGYKLCDIGKMQEWTGTALEHGKQCEKSKLVVKD